MREGAFLSTPEINGRIEKIIVKYAEPSAEEATLEIETEYKENLVSITGSKDGIWYPRNWNVSTQMYQGITVASEGQNTMNTERWAIEGSLNINYISSQMTDVITELIIIYEDGIPALITEAPEIEDEIEEIQEEFEKNIKKEAGMVSTGTVGVNNPMHSPKKKRREYYLKGMYDIVKSEMDPNFKKDVGNKPIDAKSLREFIEQAMFNRNFKGMNKSISEQIKDYILRATVKKYGNQRITGYIERKAKKEAYTGQFNNIMRTENQAMKNKVREWAYDQTDPEKDKIYKWIGPKDHRTTPICERITKRAQKGVTMDQLKVVIQQEVDRAKANDELPQNFEARDWTPHFRCRHTFVRMM